MNQSKVFAALFAAAALSPCLAQGLAPPELGPNFRSLERVFASASGDYGKFWIDGQGRYQVLEGRAPVRILAEGTLSSAQLQRVRRGVLELRAGEVQDTTVPTNGWGYAVTVDANGVLGGTFSGRAFERQRVNEIIADLNALARSLQEDDVETPSDAEGFEGSEDDVETPSDAEGLADFLAQAEEVETPSDAEGLQDLEGYSGRLDFGGGRVRLIVTGAPLTLELTGQEANKLRTLRGLYEGEVVLRGTEGEGSTFEVDEIVSPRQVTVPGTYSAIEGLVYRANGEWTFLRAQAELPSLHDKQVTVLGWQVGEGPDVYLVGFRAVTTEPTKLLATFVNGYTRDVEVGAGARILITGEVGDRFLVLRLPTLKGSMPKSALSLR